MGGLTLVSLRSLLLSLRRDAQEPSGLIQPIVVVGISGANAADPPLKSRVAKLRRRRVHLPHKLFAHPPSRRTQMVKPSCERGLEQPVETETYSTSNPN